MKVAVIVLVALALNVAALTVSKQKQQAMQQMAMHGMNKFDWNKMTAASGIKPMVGMDMPAPRTVWKGLLKNTYPGGHNFATRRALDLVITKAKTNKNLESLVTKVLKNSLTELWEDKDKQPMAAKMLVYGDFQNELRVNIDGEGGIAVAAAAKLIRGLYGKDREITPDGVHSAWWNKETGYSSANPIHSMLASPLLKPPAAPSTKWTQKRSFDTLTAFAKSSLSQAITLLRGEKTNGQTENWKKGLRLVGSVLHLIQDSACYCSARHKDIKGITSPENPANCIPGDGHGVVAYFPNEHRYKVTGLSDPVFYDARLHFHEVLDTLYEPGRVLDINVLAAARSRGDINKAYDANKAALWGDNDPAYDGGMLLLKVIENVFTSTAADQVAEALTAGFVRARYVAASKLKMPLLPAPKKK